MVALRQRSRSSFQNIIRFRDTDGRPLGEGKLPVDAIVDVPMERRTCAYADSRCGHAQPMNVSALQQVRQHWDDCRALLAWLRQLHLELTGTDTVTLVWLGQRRIPGIDSGRKLRVRGRMGKLDNGAKAIYNPHYEIQR